MNINICCTFLSTGCLRDAFSRCQKIYDDMIKNLKDDFCKNRPVKTTIFQSVQFFFETGIYPKFSTMLNTMVQKFRPQALLFTEIWLYGPFFRYYGLFWPISRSNEKIELRSRAR